jgi:hypothetical protein
MSLWLALLSAHVAIATSSFPAAIESDLGTLCRPPCTVCHTNNSGGSGTVTQPFGVAMKDRGLVGGSVSKLQDALAQMDADGVDSDGDGILDTQALTDGIDPNDGTTFCGTLRPEYGCVGGGTYAGVLLFVLPVVARRRRNSC